MSRKQTFENTVNMRRECRYEPHARTSCWVESSNREGVHPGWVIDLSRTGIGFLLEQQIAAGSIVKIKLENSDQSYDRWLTAEVKHSGIQYPNESWFHGCLFQPPLNEEELRQLIDETSM